MREPEIADVAEHWREKYQCTNRLWIAAETEMMKLRKHLAEERATVMEFRRLIVRCLAECESLEAGEDWYIDMTSTLEALS